MAGLWGAAAWALKCQTTAFYRTFLHMRMSQLAPAAHARQQGSAAERLAAAGGVKPSLVDAYRSLLTGGLGLHGSGRSLVGCWGWA